MDLRQYLTEKRMLIKDFAQLVNYDRLTIQEVMKGRRNPGRKLITAIETATNGLVTKADLLKNYKELSPTDMQ